RLDDPPAHAAREPDAYAVDVRPSVGQKTECLDVAAELDADLFEDRVGVVLDQREPFLAEDLERRELPGQERDMLGMAREPQRLACRPAAAAPPLGVVHQASSLVP